MKKIISKLSWLMAITTIMALVISTFGFSLGVSAHLVPVASASSPSVTTVTATAVTPTGATLNGSNGATAADNTSFWYGTSSAGPFTAGASQTLPSGWTSTGINTGVGIGSTFNYVVTGLTPNTTYSFVAWSEVGGIWYPGLVLSFFTDVPAAATGACSIVGTPFLTITQNITNDADSGNQGDWATDAFTENVKVWKDSDGTTYCANANTTNGAFITTGPLSPEAGVALSAGITGTFTGGENYVFPSLTLGSSITGTTASPQTLPLADSSSSGFSSWVSQVFSNATLPGSNYASTYSLTYITPNNGVWRDADSASGGDSGDITGEPVTVTVTIDKYLDGVMATTANANSADFPMVSTTTATNLNGGVASTGNYELNAADSYMAVTSAMTSGANYATNEITGGAVVGTDCNANQPFALVGYTSGATLAAAQTATPIATPPSLTNLTGNQYVIVWNHDCSIAGGTGISGTVTGGTSPQGILAVTSITPVQTSGKADGTYADGWSYLFNITVPTTETKLSMKFADWLNGTYTIPAGGNMQISSAQASVLTPVAISAANQYSNPLIMTGDASSTMPGLQVQVLVQVKIPTGSVNGSYNTNYGVQTLP